MRVLIVAQATIIEEIGTVAELILAKAQLEIIDSGYKDMKLESPDWIASKLEETKREIEVRVRAAQMRKLNKLKSQRQALRTPTEQRKDVESEIAVLEKTLTV